jgi:uncharacterized membrane protein
MKDTIPLSIRARPLLAGFFLVAGVTHFIDPQAFIAIVPPRLFDPGLLVAVSGAAEILGGVGLLIGRVRRPAGVGLILLLLAVFPANIHMLMQAIMTRQAAWRQALLWARLPLQPFLIWWVWKAAVQRRG